MIRKLAIFMGFAASAAAQSYTGTLVTANCSYILGTASTGTALFAYVDIYDGPQLVQANSASNQYAYGYANAFYMTTPASLIDGRVHRIYAKYAGTQINLSNGPQVIQCASSTGYAYYYQSTFSGDAAYWSSNGTVSTASNTFSAPANGSSGVEGSYISNVTVPVASNGSSDYEVASVLAIKASGGSYIQYLHATSDATSSSGSATQIALEDPEFTSSGCTANLTVNDISGGTMTWQGSWTIPCADGMEIRAFSGPNGMVGIIAGGTAYWATTTLTGGKPGIGAIDTPANSGIIFASLGPRDIVSPGNVSSASVKTYLTPTSVQISFDGVADDQAGVGVATYLISRDGAPIGANPSADFVDYAVSPGEPHTYTIGAQDWHGNVSTTLASVAITVPPAGSLDPRRIGVVANGGYWGGLGEQIDGRSGNLNYSIALLTAMGRGSKVPIGLSYNSQNWRQEGSISWKMGSDVGYGFGWQLLAGSLRPIYSNWALHHYVFTDATGTEYALHIFSNGVWSSDAGIYVWFDPSSNRLYFKDGSYWYFGCTSAGVEQDAGNMYPTLIQDTNGNQITITYLPGAGPYSPTGTGWNPPNTSARIDKIWDARSVGSVVWQTPPTYTFTYTPTSDGINHLTQITNGIGTSEKYTFAVDGGKALNSPFTNTSACGSTNNNCGSVGFLSSLTRSGLNLTTRFDYDSAGYGDLTQVTLPSGGHIKWAYRNFTYLYGRSVREVATRYLAKDSNSAELAYNIHHDDNGDASRFMHSWTIVEDAPKTITADGTHSGKVYFYNWDLNAVPSWKIGLMSAFESRLDWTTGPGASYQAFTWAQDGSVNGGGNAYVSQTDSYMDKGTASEQHSMTQVTLDSQGFGNAVTTKAYSYAGPSSSPALLRTTTNAYLHDSNSSYKSAYIRNRVLTTTVTPAGGSPIVMASNTYDDYYWGSPFGQSYQLVNDISQFGLPVLLTQHDPTMGTGATLRGNMTKSYGATGSSYTKYMGYDIQGNVVNTRDSQAHTNVIKVDQYGNLPVSSTPNGDNNMSTQFSFTSFFAVSGVSQPSNGTSAGVTYDTNGRVQKTTAPTGAITMHYYCPDSCPVSSFVFPTPRNGSTYSHITMSGANQPNTTTFLPQRWTRETFDGLGRVIRTERGDLNSAGTAVHETKSITDTDYDSCGCSPTGKMVRTSLPYKPGAPIYWTTYTYDGLGRTVQVTQADGSHTNYAYYGNLTVTIDPKSNWKAMSTDVDGNLYSVMEPDPAGPASAPTASNASSLNCAAASTGMLGTCYTYDAFKNLTQVDMRRNVNNQVRNQQRFFNYQQGTKWLMSATNPENGTVTYLRDVAGKVTQRTDAMGQVTKYTYDGNNRLSQVTRAASATATPDACQTETYVYDQSIDSGFPAGSAWGKLTAVQFGVPPGSGATSCPGAAADSSTYGGVLYEYAYSSSGQTTGKRMKIARTMQGSVLSANLDAGWIYDAEGRVATVTYPTHNDSYTGNPVNSTYAYTYDAMGRALNMSQTNSGVFDGLAAAVGAYNERDEILSWSYGSNYNGFGFTGGAVTETRSYNSLFQLTQISASWLDNNYASKSFSEKYVFPADGTNNGQISSVVEGTGETVTYQYDQLKRLTYAHSNLGAGWTQTFTYDGFGNLTSKGDNTFTMVADPATNRLVGLLYDANGNTYQNYSGSWRYDIENRLVTAGNDQYAYDHKGKRVFKQTLGGSMSYFFYGADGKVLGEYSVGYDYTNGGLLTSLVKETVYFGGRKVVSGRPRDRLRSARSAQDAVKRPYGDNDDAADGDGFAGYFRDTSTALEYANQRYYSVGLGRFLTPDHLRGEIDLAQPGNWNQFVYVFNDPVDLSDPRGTGPCDDLLTKISRFVFGDDKGFKGLKQRFYEQIYGSIAPGEKGWDEHNQQISANQNGLKDAMREFTDDKCPPPGNWKIIDYWANKPLPTSWNYKGPSRLPAWLQRIIDAIPSIISTIVYDILPDDLSLPDSITASQADQLQAVVDSKITFGDIYDGSATSLASAGSTGGSGSQGGSGGGGGSGGQGDSGDDGEDDEDLEN